MNIDVTQSSSVNFSQVAELPFHRATTEQLAMMYARYRFAAGYVADRAVLEIACGAGIGLGYLAQVAGHIRGIDIDENNLAYARAHLGGNPKVELAHGDAHALPCADGQYDVVILFDCIYFMRDPYKALDEAVRATHQGGTLLVSTVNVRWAGFNASRQATRYFTGEELRNQLEERGCTVRAFGAFRTRGSSRLETAIGVIRRTAVTFRLIPTPVRSKELLKRLFFGRLRAFGPVVTDGMAPAEPLVELSRDALAGDDYKILYFAASRTS